MTDIVEMLRQGLEEHEMMAMGHVLFDHAAAEIEELRSEVERLNKALKWEQYRSERVGTHGPDCWRWGHQHYECAMRHFKEIPDAG